MTCIHPPQPLHSHIPTSTLWKKRNNVQCWIETKAKIYLYCVCFMRFYFHTFLSLLLFCFHKSYHTHSPLSTYMNVIEYIYNIETNNSWQFSIRTDRLAIIHFRWYGNFEVFKKSTIGHLIDFEIGFHQIKYHYFIYELIKHESCII